MTGWTVGFGRVQAGRSCRSARALESLQHRVPEPVRADPGEALRASVGDPSGHRCGCRQPVSRAPRARCAAASACRPNDQRSIIARGQDRGRRVGDAPGRDVRRGAVDRLVDAQDAVGRARLAQRRADGSMPSEPASTDASSDRMSPNMFSVTITSKMPGDVMSCIAQESTRRCSSSTSGNSACDLVARPRATGGRRPARSPCPRSSPACGGRVPARTRGARCAATSGSVYSSVS